MGLLETMKDPLYRVISSEIAVVIKDKFPKAKYHFLVLPLENIDTVFQVRSHLVNLAFRRAILSKTANVFRTSPSTYG